MLMPQPLPAEPPPGLPDHRRPLHIAASGQRTSRPLILLIDLLVLFSLALSPLLARPAQAAGPQTSGNDEDLTVEAEHQLERRAIAERQSAAANSIIEYTVQAGDTLYGLAGQYHLSLETLIWANDLETNPAMLGIGQKLLILPVDGVLHKVQAGDTLASVAAKYHAKADAIRDQPANHLQGAAPSLQPGQKLVVPGGTKPRPAPQPVAPPEPAAVPAAAPPNAPKGTTHFVWPLTGHVSQGYLAYHRAIDILSQPGVPVKASDNGHVALAGWSNSGYGNYIIIDHENGFSSLYAHLSRIDVKAGQPVQQNDVIGAVGNTGRATAYHLHFEIQQRGVQLNPAGLLP